LYLEVIQRAIDEMGDFFPGDEYLQSVPPESQLRAFVRSILTNLLQTGRPTRLVKLMSHEMIEPTVGLDLLIERVIKPLNAALAVVVRRLIGPEAGQQEVEDCIRDIFAACHIFDHARAVITRMGQYPEYDGATIEHLIDHVTRFSLGGIRAMAAR